MPLQVLIISAECADAIFAIKDLASLIDQADGSSDSNLAPGALTTARCRLQEARQLFDMGKWAASAKRSQLGMIQFI